MDLTTYLLTLAGISAGVVAILGGFIFDKYMPICRKCVKTNKRLKDVEDALSSHESDRNERKEIENKFEALNFIDDHMEELSLGKRLSQIVDGSGSSELPKGISSYWRRARKVQRKYGRLTDNQKSQTNNYGIPRMLEMKYDIGSFEFIVCKKIVDEEGGVTSGWRESVGYAFMQLMNISEKDEDDKIVGRLNEEREALIRKRDKIANPHELIAGFVIFSAYIVFCVVAPVILSLFDFGGECSCVEGLACAAAESGNELVIKIVVASFFVAGLIAVVGYMVRILNWKRS